MTHRLSSCAFLLLFAACSGTSGSSAPPLISLPPGATARPPEGTAPSSSPTASPTGSRPREDDTSDTPASPTSPAPASSFHIEVGEAPCRTDADCLPAACCHPTACTRRQEAPDCRETMCTAECRNGTLDCGGGCLCIEGRCAAKLWRFVPPDGAPTPNAS